MSYRVAVVGATGNVGREMLQTLAEREFPVKEVIAVASTRSAGMEVSYGEDEVLKVRELDSFDFRGIDIALFSPGAKVSAVHAPRAAAAGDLSIGLRRRQGGDGRALQPDPRHLHQCHDPA